jgi:LPS-assembly lipoprotein
MSWSDRRALLALLAAAPLAACGFAPVYGPGGAGGVLRGTILADPPGDRLAYAFVARLEDRLGRPEAPAWALGYSIATREIAVGVSADNVTTRYNLTGSLSWSIRPVGGDTPVLSGTEESFTAFSATGSPVATLSARRDAEARLMTILADLLVTRLEAGAAQLAR